MSFEHPGTCEVWLDYIQKLKDQGHVTSGCQTCVKKVGTAVPTSR